MIRPVAASAAGQEAIVRFDIGSDMMVIARVDNQIRFRAGDHVPISFRTANLHFFDRGTGIRFDVRRTEAE